MSDLEPPAAKPGDNAARPQYGEYASSSEQRAHIREPMPLTPPAAPVAPARPASAVFDRGAGVAVAKPGDRIATMILLGIGAVVVIQFVFSMFDLPNAIERSYAIMGVDGEFTNFAAAKQWGVIASVLLLAIYGLTVYLAMRRIKSGKLSWWLPVVGALVAGVAMMICLAIPLSSDPAFVQWVEQQSRI